MPAMTPLLSAADSGWDTKSTYDFCNERIGIIPCKGEGEMGGRPYRLGQIERGENEGQLLFGVNTDYWETDLQSRLDERLPGEPNSLTLCKDACRDLAFLTEICNATLADRFDNRGNAKLLWVKKEENVPNDWRDAIRYGLALGQMLIESGDIPRESVPSIVVSEERDRAPFVRTPATESASGGWIRRRTH